MLLYTEKQLDSAYRVDCRARTLCNEPWILRESFRLIYETIVEIYMKEHGEDKVFDSEAPEYLLDSVNDLIESTLTLDT